MNSPSLKDCFVEPVMNAVGRGSVKTQKYLIEKNFSLSERVVIDCPIAVNRKSTPKKDCTRVFTQPRPEADVSGST